MRNTLQRQIIQGIVEKLHNHPTADCIYNEVKKNYPTISKSTVYRNLHQLMEDGKIHSVLVPDSPERFDSKLSHHYHFYCNKCGSIADVDMEYLLEINGIVENKYGFQIDEHDIFFKGICLKCKDK